MFPGGTDAGHICFIPLNRLQALDASLGQRAPQSVGGFDVDAVRGEQQVDWPWRTTGDHQRIEARALKRAGKTAAERGVEEESGEW